MGDVIVGVLVALLILGGLGLLVIGIAAARGRSIDRAKNPGN